MCMYVYLWAQMYAGSHNSYLCVHYCNCHVISNKAAIYWTIYSSPSSSYYHLSIPLPQCSLGLGCLCHHSESPGNTCRELNAQSDMMHGWPWTPLKWDSLTWELSAQAKPPGLTDICWSAGPLVKHLPGSDVSFSGSSFHPFTLYFFFSLSRSSCIFFSDNQR